MAARRVSTTASRSWWDSLEDLAAAYGSEAGKAAGAELLEDEQRFIDLPTSPLWFGEEDVVIG